MGIRSCVGSTRVNLLPVQRSWAVRKRSWGEMAVMRLRTVDADLAEMIERADESQCRRAGVVAAQFAAEHVGLDDSTAYEALGAVGEGRHGDTPERAALKALVVALDELQWKLQDRLGAGQATADEHLIAFRRARAASAIVSAGETDSRVAASEAIYERQRCGRRPGRPPRSRGPGAGGPAMTADSENPNEEASEVARPQAVEGRAAQEMAKRLRELAKDDYWWTTLFIDDRTGELWRMWFPQSEMHGGGPPSLEPISNEEARRQFLVEPGDLEPGSERWAPPWRERNRGVGSLVLIWTHPPVLHLDLDVSANGVARWLRLWLERYLDLRSSAADNDPDFSFFYVVLGHDVGTAPADGMVDGLGVHEAGYGGDPVGPQDAETTTLRKMVEWATDNLLEAMMSTHSAGGRRVGRSWR